jgi:hypothetical protein
MALYDRSLGGARPAAFINVGGPSISIGDGLERTASRPGC